MCDENRRGVLLLVVLSMLTLFLLLGAAYIAVARRARMTSRAFANNITATAAAGVQERKMVDDALLAVVRGTTSPSAAAPLRTGNDLLGDKYGYQTKRADENNSAQLENVSVRGYLSAAPSLVSGSNALISLSITRLDPAPTNTAELNGRVLTFLMPGLTASTRIIQAWGTTSGSATVVIAAGPTLAGQSLIKEEINNARIASNEANTAGELWTNIVINGREFAGQLGQGSSDTNESYDAADQNNPLLAKTLYEDRNGNDTLDTGEDLDDDGQLSSGQSKATIYAVADANGDEVLPEVDNDGDGVKDSNFIDVGLPPIVSSSGKQIYPRAAVLVVDMDGRLNANVHGTDAGMEAIQQESTDFSSGTLTATSGGQSIPFGKIPRGSGVGPAEISLERSQVFDEMPSPVTAQQRRESREFLLKDSAQLKGGRSTLRASSTAGYTNAATREVPQIGSVFGRYGGTWDTDINATNAGSTLAKPGKKNENDAITRPSDYWRGQIGTQSPYPALDYFTNPGRYASPSDWKGSLRLWVDPSTGEPVFYKPKWDGYEPGTTDAKKKTRTLNPLIDDPYEVNLTPTGPRGLPADGNAVDNLFSAAELEGLLRYYDSDSLKLSRRLVALCGNNAARNRLLVTTESWDTPAITGTAWQNVIGGPFGAYLSNPSNRPFRVFSPETVQGLQFDINRPFHDANILIEDTNKNGQLDSGEDSNNNGVLDPAAYREPNDTNVDTNNLGGGVERRQEYARQLFCLLVAVVRYQKYDADIQNNISPPFDLQSDDLDAETTRELAQFAVNVVDFRDADSVMTPFDFMCPEDLADQNGSANGSLDTEDANNNGRLDSGEDTNNNGVLDTEDLNSDGVLDEGFKPDNTTWNPNARVWGCERPELLITETHAWHDRRTDDLSESGTLSGTSPLDNDLDQSRRPVGAFFVELMGPQASQAKEYDGGVADVKGPVNTSENARAEPIPEELVDSAGDDRFETTGTIDIGKRTPASAGAEFPVWRIASVRGDVYRGTAFDDTPGAATMKIRNPAAETAAAVVDRVFYFAVPPSSLKNPSDSKDGKQGGIFWPSQAPSQQPTRSKYVVVGTDGPQFDFKDPLLHEDDPEYSTPSNTTLAYIDQVHLRFDSREDSGDPVRTPATLSEPVHTNASTNDPYEKIAVAMNQSFGTDVPGPYDNSYKLTGEDDQPFDGYTSYGTTLSDAFLTKNEIEDDYRPLLMMNGTHSNFAVVHLQRLANPLRPFFDEDTNGNGSLDSDEDTNNNGVLDSNPYLTVDSMTVDLTVVNTLEGNSSSVVDESGQAGTDPQLGWLNDNQKPFRYETVERGGKESDPGSSTVTDMWNRRVRSDVNVLEFDQSDNATWASQVAYRSADTKDSFRAATSTAVVAINFENTFRTRKNESGDKDEEDERNKDSWPVLFKDRPYVRFPWLAFHNRPFVSAAELSLVPTTSAMELGARHTTEDSASDNTTPTFYHLPRFFETPRTGSTWESLVGDEDLFRFVHTPSPFVGMRRSVPTTGTNEQTALQSIGWDFFPLQQLSEFREPGRVNVNTMPAADIWRAVQGDVILGDSADGKIADDPDELLVSPADQARDWPDADSATDGIQPFKDGFSVLSSSVGIDNFTEDYRDADKDAAFRMQTISRLNNSVTVRSNVYAIWVTVGYFRRQVDQNGEEELIEVTPRNRNRGFYIFDRSIPVAYERGEDHNVHDAILLRRTIQ